MKTCKLCDVAYIPEVGHMCDRGLEKLQVKDAKIAELEAQLASEENWHDTFEKLYLEADKDNERLRDSLASTHYHHKRAVYGCPVCDKYWAERKAALEGDE